MFIDNVNKQSWMKNFYYDYYYYTCAQNKWMWYFEEKEEKFYLEKPKIKTVFF